MHWPLDALPARADFDDDDPYDDKGDDDDEWWLWRQQQWKRQRTRKLFQIPEKILLWLTWNTW